MESGHQNCTVIFREQ